MTAPLIEICIEGPDAAVAAELGGADRVELCASLLEGGITPSLGVLRATLGAVRIPVMAMVRPRGGISCTRPSNSPPCWRTSQPSGAPAPPGSWPVA